MQDLIKCSIVIPCYNSENSIKVLIEELLNLNLKKFKIIEIICINDFSNDDTLQILQDIKKIIMFTKKEWRKLQTLLIFKF